MINISAIEKCDGCETCVTNCPVGVLEIGEGKVKIVDNEMCTDCGLCVEVCPKGAIERSD